MKPKTKLYLRVFLITGLLFGSLMSLSDLVTGEGFSIYKFIFLAVFFGLAMSITLVSIHCYELKMLGVEEFTDEVLQAHQSITVSSQLSNDELFERLESNPQFAKMKFNRSESGIEASFGLSWSSWGEIVTISTKETDDEQYEHQISSSPKLNLTLVDYGKNYQNVLKVKQLISVAA